MRTVSKGSLHRRSGTRNWSIKFYVDGHLHRESTGTPDRPTAEAFLRKRLDEAARGRLVQFAQRPTFEDLRERLIENYAYKRNRTDARRHTIRLAEHFAGMRAEVRTSKNREPRIFPFRDHARLEGVLRRQRIEVLGWEREHGRLCQAVFHWKGRPLRKLRRSWKHACERAGLPGRLLHDFRRTAVRNLIRAGIPQAIAMKITGHETDSIFRRYLIVDEELLARATGQVAAYLDEERAQRDRGRDDG